MENRNEISENSNPYISSIDNLEKFSSRIITKNSKTSRFEENLLNDLNINDHKGEKSLVKKNSKFVDNFLKRASKLIVSPLINEDINEDYDDHEIKHEKVEFNEVVNEMACYYIKEDGISTFYFSQFLESLFIHFLYFLFGPLIIPILIKKYGSILIRNMGLWGKKVGRSHTMQIIYWLSFIGTWIFTALIYFSTYNYTKNQEIFLSPAFIAQIMIFIRYITVSIKYGFFPRDYYKKWKNQRLTRTEVKSNYLLQGWIKPSLLVLDVYVREIFEKYNIDPNNFKFECVGTLPFCMNKSLIEVDRLINEDASRIRRSIYRRIKKEGKFFDIVNKAIKSNKQSLEENIIHSNSYDIETNEKTKNNDKFSENLKKKKFNFSCIEMKDLSSINPKQSITGSKPERERPYREQLRNFILNKLLPKIRNKEIKTNSIKDKVIYKNEYLYEINGIHLFRVLLKDVFTVNLESYAVIHKILVFIICLVPIIFSFTRVHIINELSKNYESPNYANNTRNLNMTLTEQNLNSTYNLDLLKMGPVISFNWFSLSLVIFSSVAIVPPIWLNTLNLLYGLVDIRRKKKLMEKITELINTNIKDEKREYPLINILHGNTMLNWYNLRNICMSLGKRFSDRIILQTSVFCLFIAIAIVASALSFLNIINNSLAFVN